MKNYILLSLILISMQAFGMANSKRITYLLRFTTGSAAAQAAGRGGIKYSVDKVSIADSEGVADVTESTGPIDINPGVETTVNSSTDTVSQAPVQ